MEDKSGINLSESRQITRVLLVRARIFEEQICLTPPLGIMYLASVLRASFKDRAMEIRLFDMGLSGSPYKELETELKEFSPDFVGFSALSCDAEVIFKSASMVKEICPRSFVAAGGPHATFFYDEVMKDGNMDCAVIGEAEDTIVELFSSLTDRGSGNLNGLKDVKGLALRDEQKNVFLTPPRPPINDIDRIPFPAWDLIDWRAYSMKPRMNQVYAANPYMGIFTSRSCPYRCAYCHLMFGKGFRGRSPENVVDEIEALTKGFGIKEIQILDDIFNFDIERAEKICDLIIERGIKIKISFPNGLRGDRLPKRLIHKLKAAGTFFIVFAVETASERLQAHIKKNIDIEKITSAIDEAYKVGILTSGFFILGFPTETIEEIQNTIDYACRSRLLKAHFFSLVVYPRTDMYELARSAYPGIEFGIKDMKNVYYFSEIPFYTQATGIDLSKIQKEAHRRFYLNPWRIYQIIKRFPKNLGLLAGIYSGITALFAFVLTVDRKSKSLKAGNAKQVGRKVTRG